MTPTPHHLLRINDNQGTENLIMQTIDGRYRLIVRIRGALGVPSSEITVLSGDLTFERVSDQACRTIAFRPQPSVEGGWEPGEHLLDPSELVGLIETQVALAQDTQTAAFPLPKVFLDDKSGYANRQWLGEVIILLGVRPRRFRISEIPVDVTPTLRYLSRKVWMTTTLAELAIQIIFIPPAPVGRTTAIILDQYNHWYGPVCTVMRMTEGKGSISVLTEKHMAERVYLHFMRPVLISGKRRKERIILQWSTRPDQQVIFMIWKLLPIQTWVPNDCSWNFPISFPIRPLSCSPFPTPLVLPQMPPIKEEPEDVPMIPHDPSPSHSME